MQQKIKGQRRDRSAWREILSRLERSGLSVLEFCRRERLDAWSVYRWRTRLGGGGQQVQVISAPVPEKPSAGGFIDLGALGDSGGARCEVRLDLGGGVLLTLVRG
jgi:hypothetical protein